MKRTDLLLSITVMVIWGFNFSMIKLGVSDVNPLVSTAARFAIAAIPVVFFIPKPDVPWRYVVSYGLLFGVGVWGMASWSITAGLSSGMSSVLLQANVLIGMAVGVFILKESLPTRKLIGAIIASVALVISIAFTNGNVTGFGLFLVAISAVSWAAFGLVVKASKTKNAFVFNVWGMLVAPIPLLLLAVFIHGDQVLAESIQQWTWNTSFAVAFQAYPTTLFGYWVWNNMLIRYPMSTVAPLTLLVPVFALISGFVIFDETLSVPQVIACSLFLIGISLIVRAPKKAAPIVLLSVATKH
ncbi:EamA family transporter [Vibrio sp. ZSDE26]|uniref:EamA family transporter n=1 Tax=Vibrio amylolyticus TaxID=2847292 RepID=A0A9X1XLX1_9VIBR|nr:EamA family transporter [Vibrio amylolyticus]MCK6264228.1 EamA family transporter [Vibrio amylolyticus]